MKIDLSTEEWHRLSFLLAEVANGNDLAEFPRQIEFADLMLDRIMIQLAPGAGVSPAAPGTGNET